MLTTHDEHARLSVLPAQGNKAAAQCLHAPQVWRLLAAVNLRNPLPGFLPQSLYPLYLIPFKCITARITGEKSRE